jgi:hypothetical protein
MPKAWRLPAAIALAFVPTPVLAQATGSADAQVGVLESGSIIAVADMNFGAVLQPAAAGTVVLTPNPTASCTTTGGLVRSGPCRAAEFALMATRQARVRLNHPGNGAVTLAGPGGATMQMTNLTLSVSNMSAINGGGNANLGRFQITAQNGIANFRLGGTLHVGAYQAAGAYTGELVIQAQFN